jgi:peptidoglycan/xylan/chitin deacetylase (PgdA/CDA1 family)
MEFKVKDGIVCLFFLLCLILIAPLITGCATPQVTAPETAVPEATVPEVISPEPVPHQEYVRLFPDFVAVIARPGDTLPLLASKYLNDPSKDWLIAEFNEIETLNPGQELIVPLKPFKKGGLTQKGYQTVPVLVYHRFSLTKKSKMTVTKAAFEEQLKLLKDKGYRVITLDQLFDFMDFKGQIPEKSVVITIDDGWRSAYDIALPVLKKYGYTATLFIYTDLITGSQKTLSWELIREMADSGLDVQCHTKTHRNLTLMDKKESFRKYFERINEDLSAAEKIIKKKLNKSCKYLAYPYSDTNELVIALLKKHGYRGAFTVKRGSNPFFINNYRINRSVIYGNYDLKKFEKNLSVFTDEELK